MRPCRFRLHRTQCEVLGQLVFQFGFGGNLLFPSCIDLGASAASAADEGPDGCAFAAAQNGSQDRADRGASANVLSGALICAEAAGSGLALSSTGQQIAATSEGDVAQIKIGVFAWGHG